MINSIQQMTDIEIANTILGIILSALSIVLIIIPLIKKIMRRLLCFYLCPNAIRKEDFLRHTRIFVPTRLVRYYKKNREQHFSFFKFAKLIIHNSNQYVFVLGDAGTGKTTFLLNLYLYLRRRLIRYKVVYIALRSNDILTQISNIDKKRITILLLDGFDEAYEVGMNFSEHLFDIENCTQEFYKVVITSRRHFFDSMMDEPDLVHIHRAATSYITRYIKFEIECFNDDDIKTYLKKKYLYNIAKRIKARRVIDGIPNTMARPMLLTFIDDLIEHKIKYDSSFDIYKCLIDKWIRREVRFIYNSILSRREKKHSEDLSFYYNNYRDFANQISMEMYSNKKFCISTSMLQQCAIQYNIDFKLTKRGRSLLTRINDYEFSFFHRTVLEYFIAMNYMYIDNFKAHPYFDMLYQFIIESHLANVIIEKQMKFYLCELISEGYISPNAISTDNSFYYPVIGRISAERIDHIMVVLENKLNRDFFEQRKELFYSMYFSEIRMILNTKFTQFMCLPVEGMTANDTRFIYPILDISDGLSYKANYKADLPYLSQDENYIVLKYTVSCVYKRLYDGYIVKPTEIIQT